MSDLPIERDAPLVTAGDPLHAPEVPQGTSGAPIPESTDITEPVEAEPVVPDGQLRPALEAILMVVDEPVALMTLAQVVERPADEVAAELAALAAEYADQGRGFELREVAVGWRFYTRSEFAAVVEKFVLDGQQARLTQAALETLAVVAYRQPVSRARISAVRGVSVDGVMRTLVARGLVEESGTETESGSILYRTTSYFLERLGISSMEELPGLAPYLPELDTLDNESLLSSS